MTGKSSSFIGAATKGREERRDVIREGHIERANKSATERFHEEEWMEIKLGDKADLARAMYLLHTHTLYLSRFMDDIMHCSGQRERGRARLDCFAIPCVS